LIGKQKKGNKKFLGLSVAAPCARHTVSCTPQPTLPFPVLARVFLAGYSVTWPPFSLELSIGVLNRKPP
jgi:hypothetical protein